MRFGLALLVAAGFAIGCGGSLPLSPDVASAGSASTVVPDPGKAPTADPSGVSCPSDAPQIRVGSLGLRMDIDFSEIKGAYAYEIQIDYYNGQNVFEPFAHLEIPAPAKRAQWYGKTGRFLVRVRTMNCGGLGNWSDAISHALSDGEAAPAPPPSTPTPSPTPPPAPKPKPKPRCTGKC